MPKMVLKKPVNRVKIRLLLSASNVACLQDISLRTGMSVDEIADQALGYILRTISVA